MNLIVYTGADIQSVAAAAVIRNRYPDATIIDVSEHDKKGLDKAIESIEDGSMKNVLVVVTSKDELPDLSAKTSGSVVVLKDLKKTRISTAAWEKCYGSVSKPVVLNMLSADKKSEQNENEARYSEKFLRTYMKDPSNSMWKRLLDNDGGNATRSVNGGNKNPHQDNDLLKQMISTGKIMDDYDSACISS